MKIKPCKKCRSTDIRIYDCGYSTFNCGGGECMKCGYKSGSGTLSWNPEEKYLIKLWNDGQKPTVEEKLKTVRRVCTKLRNQLRALGQEPEG